MFAGNNKEKERYVKKILIIIFLLSVFIVQSFALENKLPLKKLEPLSQKVIINTDQMSLNKVLNVIRNNTETSIVLAPEYGGKENLMMMLALPKGMMSLRELLDVICIQLQGKWIATDNGKKVVVNALPKQVEVMEKMSPEKSLYSVESEGKTLLKVLAKLRKQSGLKFTIFGGVENMKIEMIIHDATIAEIMSHIAFLYDLNYSYADGIYRIGKK